MTETVIDPIVHDWTSNGLELVTGASHATAAEVNQQLALLQVVDIEDVLVPFLAAAGAEMALASDIAWPFSTDDPPVALLRLIAKAASRNPNAGGPHTDRLLAVLEGWRC